MTRMNSLPEKYQKQVDTKNTGTKSKLTIPGELPTMNKIINRAKGHWSKYRNLKQEYDNLVAYYADNQRIKFFESVELNITYYMRNRKKDPDNILSSKKFILDGLVQAGVLENDGWKQVKSIRENWEVDRGNPRIEINFREVRE